MGEGYRSLAAQLASAGWMGVDRNHPTLALQAVAQQILAMTNRLYDGDNLEVLREHIASESIDLIYLDPPFNSNANYNILFKFPPGQGVDSQIEVLQLFTLAEYFHGLRPKVPLLDRQAAYKKAARVGDEDKRGSLL